MRRVAVLVACAIAFAARAQPAPLPALRVLAAASLTEVVGTLAKRFDGAEVKTSFGASSDLARQIKDGAPADVFVSASPDWIDFLREANALDGDAVVVARNALVAIAPKGSPLAARGAGDPKALLAALAADDRVAIAAAGVPAGDYARKALERLVLFEGYRPHLVGQKDVRAVLHAVEQREMAAGFVYATDGKVADVVQLFVFDPATHPPIEYHAAALRRAANPAGAKRFLAHLRSDTARTVLREAGFSLP